MTVRADLERLLERPEGTNAEFKEAARDYSFVELLRYCVALANEGGGYVVLGVTDQRPRVVVGTAAFPEPGRTAAGVYQRLGHRVEIDELAMDGRRVLVVQVPGRLPGTAWQIDGAFLMRAGDALVAMSDERLRVIHAETGPDFSAQICADAAMSDLDVESIELLRRLWQRKSGRDLSHLSVDQLLADCELLIGGAVTYAALVLLATREALGRLLGQAEVVFEYRSTEAPGPASERREYRQGFLRVLDELWQAVQLRNDLQHFQQGLFVWDVPTFSERAVREAILNAAAHRDYRLGGSIFVRQYPKRIEITSPGGLPPGITLENVLWEQNPRNRRVAEVLSRCGLVERAGQGFDLMYTESIKESKPLPDLSRTSDTSVWVTLSGDIQDPEFLRFLEAVGDERAAAFSIQDLLAIDLVHREQAIPPHLQSRLRGLVEQGIIERVGRGRGVRYLLSRRFYRFLGQGGVYTRQRGLDRETNKALLLRHIAASEAHGTQFAELQQVLPGLSRGQLRSLLRELHRDGRITVAGTTRAARWFPASKAQSGPIEAKPEPNPHISATREDGHSP